MRLGRTSLSISEVCLGTLRFGNTIDQATAFAIMDLAYSAGVRFLDTADVYPPPGVRGLRGRAEEIVGNWFKSRGVRDQVVLATKVGKPMGPQPHDAGLGRRHIQRACEESLRRLQTEFIDLYQAHAPDAGTPIEETLLALHELVQAGKVRFIGCSNYSAGPLVEALWTSDRLGLTRFDAYQAPYNLLIRDLEGQTLPLCGAYNLSVLAARPLAGGALTEIQAKRQPDSHPLSVLERFVAERGLSLTHVAVAWVLSQPTVASVVIGASRPEQLADSLSAVRLRLEDDVRSACASMLGSRGGAIAQPGCA